MGEQGHGNHRTASAVRYVWVAHSDEALALWELVDWDDGTHERSVVGLNLLGGPDEHGVVRFPRRAAEQQVDEPGRPSWEAAPAGWRTYEEMPDPPPWHVVRDAYDDFQPVEERFTEHLEHPRRDGESSDDFYGRIARLYRAYARANGKPVATIAERLGVPKTTAGNWVTAARKRGLLPATGRGRVRV
jgi:hypothetical protein